MTPKRIAPVLLAMMAAACGTPRSAEQTAAVATAQWQSNTLEIDGSDNEWIGSTMAFYNEKAKVGYSVTSDKNNLYVLLRTTDPQVQQQIARGGLTLLINSHGVKDDHGAAGLVFPTGNLHQKDNVLSARPELNSNINVALSNAQDYSLFGFTTVKTVENYDFGKPNPEGIEMAVGINGAHALVYEAVIPFTAIFNQSGALNAPGRNIAIGFVIDDVPGQQGSGGRGGGVSFGGGLGIGSFGGGGGIGLSIGTGALGGRGRNGGRLNQTRIWREITLAKEPSQK